MPDGSQRAAEALGPGWAEVQCKCSNRDECPFGRGFLVKQSKENRASVGPNARKCLPA